MSTRDETLPEGRWAFGPGVAEVFDDMLARSIPQYDVMRQAAFDVGSRFVKRETAVVDLGCSRGEALAPFIKAFGAQNRYVGCEVSLPMLTAARKRFASYADSSDWRGGKLVEILELDLRRDYPPHAASVVLSVLTLQFTPVEYRTRILEKVVDSLVSNGALVLVEKVIGATGGTDEMFTDLYHRRKREEGYTDEQIARKALALEGVLVPVTAAMNEAMLRDAGFRTVECFWRWMNFAGWVAVR